MALHFLVMRTVKGIVIQKLRGFLKEELIVNWVVNHYGMDIQWWMGMLLRLEVLSCPPCDLTWVRKYSSPKVDCSVLFAISH